MLDVVLLVILNPKDTKNLQATWATFFELKTEPILQTTTKHI